MTSNPLVSIIIPVFNVELYIKEALNSVINQTYSNLEILVIDDGSTDNSGIICDQYGKCDERVTVIHQNNQGLSAARNIGLNLMNGEICAFLDSDDAYECDFIEQLLNVLIVENVDLVISKYTVHQIRGLMARSNEKSLPSCKGGRYDRKEALISLADNTINHHVWNKVYRSELWNNIRFPDGNMYEDIDTSFRVFDVCKSIYVIDDPLYLYRRRQDSITDTISLTNLNDRHNACMHFSSFIQSNTPEVFTHNQAKKWSQSTLNELIYIYITHFDNNYEFYSEVRKKTILIGKENGIDTLNYRMRIAWHLILLCPWLSIFLYDLYKAIRKLFHKFYFLII